MAEDTSTQDGTTTGPVTDGTSNTVVLEEKAGDDGKPGTGTANGNTPDEVVVVVGGEPPPGNENRAPNNEPFVVGLFAVRDSETGGLTLTEGASTGGGGEVQVAGTDLVFENQEEFQAFLADANAKEDAGVPFSDILGQNASGVPVIENGTFTGETLADAGQADAAAPAQGAGQSPVGGFTEEEKRELEEGGGAINPATGQNEGGTPDGNGSGATGANQDTNPFSNEAPPRRGGADPDSNGAPANPSANGNGGRQPGRDENGNLLPGADGRVETGGAGFREINDLNNNGILDGQENPVDLGGNGRDEEAPGGNPPPAPPPSNAGHDPHDDGQRVGIVIDPVPGGRGRFEDDERVLTGDGTAIIREDDDGTLRGDGFATVRDERPPVGPLPVQPGYDSTVPEQAPPATAPVATTETPGAPQPAAAVASPPASEPAPAVAAVAPIDTFETGTAPSAPEAPPVAAIAEAPAVPASNFAAPPPAPAASESAAALPAAESYETEAGDGALAASPQAISGPTDVFDEAKLGAAVATAVAGAREEGGANLLERIFDRVKDLLFDDGPSTSPVQLPVQREVSPDELPTGPVVNADQSIIPLASEESLADMDDDPDDTA